MIEFHVSPDGGEPYEVTATSRDVYIWEKLGKGRTLAQLKDNLQMADMYQLAHLASKRQQLFTGSLEEFTDTVDLDFEEEEDEGPTRPGASTEQ